MKSDTLVTNYNKEQQVFSRAAKFYGASTKNSGGFEEQCMLELQDIHEKPREEGSKKKSASDADEQVFTRDAGDLESLERSQSGSDSLGQSEDGDGFTYAEGGLGAWMVVLGSFLGMFPTWGLYFSAGVIQTYISTHQLTGTSTSSVSWIFSIYNCILLGSSVFSGMYFDRYGARKPLVFGSVLIVAGILALGNCTKVWQFILALSVCVALGCGIACSPLLGSLCHFFYRKRALATAVAINGGSIGGIVLPIFLENSYRNLGFTWTMRIMALIAAIFLTASIFLVKDDSSKRALPIASGDAQVSIFNNVLLNLRDSFDYKSIVSDFKFLFCVLATCLAEVSTGAVLTFITSYCTSVGYSDNSSFIVVTILNSLSIVGGYIFSFLADKVIGRFNVMILITFMLGIIPFIIWLPFGSKNLNVMYAFSSIYGLFYGSLINLAPVCCGQISRTDEFGRRYATMYCFVGISFLIAIPVSGVIIGDGSLHNYNNFIIYVSILSIFSSALYSLSKGFAVKQKLRQSARNAQNSTILCSVFNTMLKRF